MIVPPEFCVFTRAGVLPEFARLLPAPLHSYTLPAPVVVHTATLPIFVLGA